jgi:hypothetical protein
MTNQEITDSGFLIDFIVLGLVKTRRHISAEDCIDWALQLGEIKDEEGFAKLVSHSTGIITKSSLDAPLSSNADKFSNEIKSLLDAARSSRLFPKLVECVELYGKNVTNATVGDFVESVIKKLKSLPGMESVKIIPLDGDFKPKAEYTESDKTEAFCEDCACGQCEVAVKPVEEDTSSDKIKIRVKTDLRMIEIVDGASTYVIAADAIDFVAYHSTLTKTGSGRVVITANNATINLNVKYIDLFKSQFDKALSMLG